MNKVLAVLWGLTYLLLMYVIRPIDVALVCVTNGYPYISSEYIKSLAFLRWDELSDDCSGIKGHIKGLWND